MSAHNFNFSPNSSKIGISSPKLDTFRKMLDKKNIFLRIKILGAIAPTATMPMSEHIFL